jgi:pimeloyl-ACP methyl ester carboxylesterase
MNDIHFRYSENRIKSAIVDVVRELNEKEHEKRAVFLAVTVLDFGNVFRIGVHSLKGIKCRYQPYQLNPQNLTQDQLGRSATLLIHGWMHNQGVWKNMAKHLSKEEGLGALFTVNLPWRGTDEENRLAVQEKIREINAQYRRSGVRRPRINLVGYSNGGMAAIDTSEFAMVRLKRQISKLIMIGCHLSNYYYLGHQTLSKVYAIAAAHEFLDTDICRVPNNKKTQINTTHLGLLQHPYTASALAFILKQE